ncbi:uncharacterized protein LOC119302944 [Triticum dicoccoides]|uniref:uncharacterized protein LOC119302944 n=1 Tax=Triticum dicoccoides TaxID=85692 RepID=UPI0018907784|nr:uncharacterized protein LOC119302944 [Triticum dicoccoides]XP_037435903.1 uncharacterized protein LOC119302944 [Triticum dicoccoides]
MRFQGPRCSFREDAADMAGAIFMSNSETRDHCFNTGVFGLPPEYGPFVANVKQGMPLFLFDYTFRKLYGVFEAASDGSMDISRTTFRSTGRAYPAQVCFNIVWKCRPLTEDEFFPAIEENYYISKKFYFDLSYQQVVQLYGLFDKKRVEHPICNYSTSANLEKEHSSRRRPDKRSLSPNSPPFSADRSHTLIPSSTPKISTVETNCSASTSMHLIAPPTFETQPNVSMPLVTKAFGAQTAPIYGNQIKLPYHSQQHLPDVSAIDGTSTQVSAPCSQAFKYHQDQFVANQSYPSSDDYPHNSLSSGCMTQGPTDGVRLSVKQSYGGSSLSCSRYLTQVPTGDERSYLTSTPYFPSYHDSSLESPQHNAHWKGDYDINCDQCREMYASERLHLNRRKSVTPPESTQLGIPAYPEAPKVSAIIQHKESFTGYIPIHDRPEDLEKEQQRRDFNRDGSASSGSGHETLAYISDRPYTDHDVGSESKMAVPSQRPQKNVFSHLSVKPQLPPQEVTGPSMNQLLYLLSQRTKQWSNKSISPREDVCKQLVREQDMDMPCPLPELNLPSGLEGEESADPPFLNFKRRSKAAGLDTNIEKEVTDRKKRRKLVRPSFGVNNTTGTSGNDLQGNAIVEVRPSHEENNTTGNSGSDLQGNAITERNQSPASIVERNQSSASMVEMNHSPAAITERNQSPAAIVERNQSLASIVERNQSPAAIIERNHSPVETDGNKFIIDLNEPASVESDLAEDGSIAPCPVATNTQTEKSCEVDVKKQNCSNSAGVITKQDVQSDSGAPTEKITLDLNITDLNTMDEVKLQAILGSSLLQALDKLRNSKSNDDSNKAKSSASDKNNNSQVKMEMKSETSTRHRCN